MEDSSLSKAPWPCSVCPTRFHMTSLALPSCSICQYVPKKYFFLAEVVRALYISTWDTEGICQSHKNTPHQHMGPQKASAKVVRARHIRTWGCGRTLLSEWVNKIYKLSLLALVLQILPSLAVFGICVQFPCNPTKESVMSLSKMLSNIFTFRFFVWTWNFCLICFLVIISNFLLFI